MRWKFIELLGSKVREYAMDDSRTGETIVWYDEPEKFPHGRFLEVRGSNLDEARQKAKELWTI